MESNTSHWRGANIGYNRQWTLVSCFPVEYSSHASGKRGFTDHIVTNIVAFLDFVPIQLVIRNLNGEAVTVVDRGCSRISITKGNSNANKRMFCVYLTIPQTSYPSPDARIMDISSLSKNEIAAWISRSELGKTNTRKQFVLLTLQRSSVQDELQQRDTGQCKEMEQMIGSYLSKRMWSGKHHRQWGNLMMYAMCAH